MNRITKRIISGLVLGLFAISAYARDIPLYVSNVMTPDTNISSNILQIGSAKSGDEITIYIDSPGGYINNLYLYEGALGNTKAHVTVVVNHLAASAAAGLMCMGNTIKVSPQAHILFHRPFMIDTETGAQSPAPQEVVDRATMFYHQHCMNILTEKEVQEIAQGRQLWLTGQEVYDRIQNHLR